MELNQVVESLRKRVPWPVMSKFLSHYGFLKGHGWEGTAEKIIENHGTAPDEVKEKNLKILSQFYREHLLAGEKSIRLYRVDESLMHSIMTALDQYKMPDSLLKSAYPYPLNDSDLECVDEGVYPVSIEHDDDEKVLLVFSAKRHIKEKVEIAPSSFGSDAIEALGHFSEIYGIKEYTRQFFDVLAFDIKANVIEIRLDIAANISSDDRNIGFSQTKKKFCSLIRELGVSFEFGSEINLFPAIDKLYRLKEGRVCELAFTTEEGSIKHEKMRRKHLCLREETYHKAGALAVDGHIFAYRIATTWTHKSMNSQPELLLPGSSRMLSKPKIYLGEALITKCCGFSDYGFVMNKLNSLVT